MVKKSRVIAVDSESAVAGTKMTSETSKDDTQYRGSAGMKITSLYLARQEPRPQAEKYRQYMDNKDIFRAQGRKHLFKGDENSEAEDRHEQKFDFTRYRMRRCEVGIPTKKVKYGYEDVVITDVTDVDICGCGRPMTSPIHNKKGSSGTSPGDWRFEKHTTTTKTNAYGRVAFSSDRTAKYVRLDVTTPEKDVFDLLTNVYNLKTPGVIISVVGSLLGFMVSPKIEKIIQRGMIKAAITTSGWITTSGFDAGHVISVGDALRAHNHSVPCIGFPSWGCLPDGVQEALVVGDHQGKETTTSYRTCRYPRTEIEPGSSRENLNANHSHFVISDTGAVCDWGKETVLRTKVEAYIKDTMHIPVVQVVMQGGVGVASHLLKAVKAGTTSVVVYRSGGLCDVLVDLSKHHDSLRSSSDAMKGPKSKFSSKIKIRKPRRTSSVASLEEALRKMCVCSGEKGLNMDCPGVEKILETANIAPSARTNKQFKADCKDIVENYRDLLILFDMEDEHYDGLDTALLEALVRAQNMNVASDQQSAGNIQLSGVQVALGWNRPDFAEKILSGDNASKDEKALGTILMHALAFNLFDFTELLLNHGASVPMVTANIVLLYGSAHNVDHLKRYLRYHLGGNHDRNIRLDNKDTVDKLINKLSGIHIITENKFHSNVSNESDPYFELMVWASLCLFPEVAELMWSNTQEPIKGALFVLMLLRKLVKSKKVIITNNEKETINYMRRRFEQLAIDIMDGLHQNCDSSLREKALNCGWGRLDDLSYIDMAYMCKAKDFVAHPACQELQDIRWKRGLTSEVGFFTTILVFLFPFLVLSPLVNFRGSQIYAHPDERHTLNPFQKWVRKFKAFCISPSVKFWMEVAMYLLFLFFQTYVVLFQTNKVIIGKTHHVFGTAKIVYFVWFGVLLLDEVIQVSQAISLGHFWRWYNVVWNRIDATMYLLNTLGLIGVHIPLEGKNPDPDIDPPDEGDYSYHVGRVFLSISSIMFILRLVHMFISDKYLGPTVLMINKMLKDFKVFLIMFFMVLIAFGIGYAIMITDPSDLGELGCKENLDNLGGIFFYTVFQMFGELFVDDLSSATTTVYFPSQSKYRDIPNRSLIRRVAIVGLVAMYMAIVVLMLVNILIAMFSDTYSRVKKREDVIFKYQRLELLMEMEESYLPPPFSIFHFILAKIIESKAEKDYQKNRRYHEKDNKWYDTVIRSAVIDSLEDYLKKRRVEKGSEVETLIKQSTRVLKNKIKYLHDVVDTLNGDLQRALEDIKLSLDVREY